MLLLLSTTSLQHLKAPVSRECSPVLFTNPMDFRKKEKRTTPNCGSARKTDFFLIIEVNFMLANTDISVS